MLKDKKLFRINDLEVLPAICLTVAEKLVKDNNLHAAIDMLSIGKKVYEHLGKETIEWTEKIAKHYETLMIQAEQNNNLASTTFCQQALKKYKKIKNQKKVEELGKKFLELKSSAQLQRFEEKIDLSKHIEVCSNIAKKVAQRSEEEIIRILMLDHSLLPQFEVMNKRAEEQEKVSILDLLGNTEMMDQNGNPIQHFSTPEEKRYYNILKNYQMEIELNKSHLIDRIFLESIRADKFNTRTILNFLAKNSWFGKNLSKTIAQNTITYNWIGLVAPSLQEYFWQIENYLVSPANSPNFVLCIDSLSLKFEGLFRDMCRLSGLVTCYFTKDSSGRDIVQEKDIHALLYEDKAKNLFDEDDLLFFRFLLVEKAGYNLRHKVAHALIYFQEYGFSQMNLLIMALLRIGKYDFAKD